MPSKKHTTLVSNLSALHEQLHGYISLSGDHGGQVLITGGVSPSLVMQGCHAIKTEVGTVYLGDEEEIEVIETW